MWAGKPNLQFQILRCVGRAEARARSSKHQRSRGAFVFTRLWEFWSSIITAGVAP